MNNKEFKIGLISFLVLVMLIIGVNYLKGLNVFSKNRIFYAIYEDIGGLQIGAPIMVNGYQIGMVGDIELLINQKQNLLVTLNIEKEINIPVNSISRIVNRDLMGTKGVSLKIGNSVHNLNIGDTLISSIEGSLQDEVNAQILPLKNKAEELIGSMDSVMVIITAVLNKDARNNLSNGLKSLDRTFKLMSQTMIKVDDVVSLNDNRISKIIVNLESISNNIEGSNNEVKKILANVSDLSTVMLESNIKNTLKNLHQISNKIEKGEGSVGLLMKDDKIYKNLEKSTKELAELIRDIKRNPSRYMKFSILGGSKPYKKE